MHPTGSSVDVLTPGLGAPYAAAAGHGGETSYTLSPFAGVPLILVAFAFMFIEWQQRAGMHAGSPRGGVQKIIAPLNVGRVLVQLIPEVLVLAMCALVASAVIMRADNNGSVPTDEVSKSVWVEITNEWPILMTADTLLGLQAMIRLVLCLSATFRYDGFDASPLANEPAGFFLLAGISRLTLLAVSPWDWFHVDGPLGGAINYGFELVAFPFLLTMSRGMLRQGLYRQVLFVFSAILACGAAWCNRFSLAGHGFEYMDMLFSLSHCFELLAAATFLARTVVLGSESANAFTSFAHVLLPVQQSFSMYFLLTAFALPLENVPELVGAGRPFEVYEIAGVVQVGMYLFAAVMYLIFISSVDVKEDGPYLPTGVQLAEALEHSLGRFQVQPQEPPRVALELQVETNEDIHQDIATRSCRPCAPQ